MKNKYSIVLGLMVGVSLLQGCSHNVAKVLDEKLAQEQEVPNQAALRVESGQAIEKTPGLTTEQRTKLISLREKLRAEMSKLQEESLKLRGILIKDVISPTYDDAEVTLIKQRLESVEKQRLAAIFQTIDKANDILGRPTADHARIMHDLFTAGRAF